MRNMAFVATFPLVPSALDLPVFPIACHLHSISRNCLFSFLDPLNIRMDNRNKLGLLLLLVSLGLLIPGLTSDILTLDVSFSVPLLGRQNVFNETRSILGTISSLFENGNALVGFLILLFSVMVPLAKALSLLIVLLVPRFSGRASLLRLVALISKWSMADVFVVGVFIAFMSTNSNENVGAAIHSGFYFFTGYCLVSIAAAQIIRVPTQSA